jgi:hypothetical protein
MLAGKRQQETLRKRGPLPAIREETTRKSKISAIKLAAVDVDGTSLRGKNICDCIARIQAARWKWTPSSFFLCRMKPPPDVKPCWNGTLPFGSASLTGDLSELRLAPRVKEGFARA